MFQHKITVICTDANRDVVFHDFINTPVSGLLIAAPGSEEKYETEKTDRNNAVAVS